MSIKEMEALLEATRQKLAKQESMTGKSLQSADPRLYEKERVLEQAVIDAHLDARKHWNVAADYVVNLDLEKEQDTTDWKQELRDSINDKSKKYDMPRDKHGYANLMAQLAANNEIDKKRLDAPLVEDGPIDMPSVTPAVLELLTPPVKRFFRNGVEHTLTQEQSNEEIDAFIERKILEEQDDEG